MVMVLPTGDGALFPVGLSTGEVAEAYRPYLLAIANQELDSQIRQKVAASDIVQDSLLEAHLGSQDFRGQSLLELKEWLRQILRHNLANAHRSFQRTEKRRQDREVPLDDSAQLSLRNRIPSEDSTPLSQVRMTDELRQLQRNLDELPADLRQIVVWHNLEQLSFPLIASRMGCSEKSVQKKWVRAIHELKTRMALRLPS